MIKINLLPHREEKRKARRDQFYALLGLVAIVAGVVWFVGHTYIAERIDKQNGKNAFLKAEIATLDAQIAEINSLREQTDSLLARKHVIELLEANRAETVHIFNELASRVPDGVYLTKVAQSGAKINLLGHAQANSRVSTLMHNLEESPLLQKADLVEIKSELIGGKRLSVFNMNIMLKRETEEKLGKDGKPKKKEGSA